MPDKYKMKVDFIINNSYIYGRVTTVTNWENSKFCVS